MKIGITEKGDAGLDLTWSEKLKSMDGAILITKNLTEKCKSAILDAHNAGRKLILHLGCTGWGQSPVEPNVPPYTMQIDSCMNLIERGFPMERIVLRIDPIIPTDSGLNAVHHVIDYAISRGLLPSPDETPRIRIRISVLDEYRHVKERLEKAGYASFYPGTKFNASNAEFRNVTKTLKPYGFPIHTCAEPKLTDPDGMYIHSGCVSKYDLDILGLEMPKNTSVNGQNRFGCQCLTCKTELLTQKKQCPNKCIYCYWKD